MVAGSSELSAAVENMSALQSVRIVQGASGLDTVTIDYQAPDRLRIVQPDGQESLQIGSTIYAPEFGRPGFFRPITSPPNGFRAKDLFLPLESMRSGTAVRSGDSYRVAAPDDTGAATAKVKDGHVSELVLDSDGVQRVYTFSLFNSAPPVLEPPADHVLPASPAPQPCTSGQQPPPMLCFESGPTSTDETVELPALRSDFVASDMQIRPITNPAATDRSTEARNPEPTSTARLSDGSGHCLELAPSELTISQAQASAVRERVSDTIAVDLELNDADAAILDQVAKRHLLEQVAIVMFGQVVSAPTFVNNEPGAQMQIGGLTPSIAAEVVASMST